MRLCYKLQLTIRQCGFELRGPLSDNILISLAYFFVRIANNTHFVTQQITHIITYKIRANSLFMWSVRLTVSRLLLMLSFWRVGSYMWIFNYGGAGHSNPPNLCAIPVRGNCMWYYRIDQQLPYLKHTLEVSMEISNSLVSKNRCRRVPAHLHNYLFLSPAYFYWAWLSGFPPSDRLEAGQ